MPPAPLPQRGNRYCAQGREINEIILSSSSCQTHGSRYAVYPVTLNFTERTIDDFFPGVEDLASISSQASITYRGWLAQAFSAANRLVSRDPRFFTFT
jgi:hypothetical protein